METRSSGQEIKLEGYVRMLALGDSYTIGESEEMDKRWPHQFIAALRKQGIQADTPAYIATTGWTTSDLLQGMSDGIDPHKEYNLVSILIGVNNQYQQLDIDIYEPELQRIIEQAMEIVSGEVSRIFMLSIPDYAFTPFGKGDKLISSEIDAYNRINRKMSEEYGIAWFDITVISRRGLAEPGLVAGDGLHPSGEQYRLWVKELISHLEHTP